MRTIFMTVFLVAASLNASAQEPIRCSDKAKQAALTFDSLVNSALSAVAQAQITDSSPYGDHLGLAQSLSVTVIYRGGIQNNFRVVVNKQNCQVLQVTNLIYSSILSN